MTHRQSWNWFEWKLRKTGVTNKHTHIPAKPRLGADKYKIQVSHMSSVNNLHWLMFIRCDFVDIWIDVACIWEFHLEIIAI